MNQDLCKLAREFAETENVDYLAVVRLITRVLIVSNNADKSDYPVNTGAIVRTKSRES
jgi:hypothetical protein